MQPHQERVIEEKQELDNRINKLSSFFDTNIFSSINKDEQGRLIRQYEYMKLYSKVLSERIENFN